MKRIPLSTTFVIGLALSTVSVAPAQTATAAPVRPPITLKVGDQAPPLKLSKWIKGKQVASLADGTVHVIEFWATWCGPCKSSMPHLSNLAERFGSKASFIGVNIWESRGKDRDFAADLAKATRFVSYAKDTMDYTVAMDTSDDDMAKTWMAAAGQNGIPASFVIDGTGKILWIGHPQVGLEEVVALAIDHKLDEESGKRIKTETRAKFTEFYALMKTHEDAMKAGDYKAAYDAGDKASKLLPSITDPIEMKLSALVHTDRAAARDLARQVLKEYRRWPLFLASAADVLLGDKSPNPTKEDYELGLELVKAAADRLGPDDLMTQPMLALAYHKVGQDRKAVDIQQHYIDLLKDPALKAPPAYVDSAKERLAEYKSSS